MPSVETLEISPPEFAVPHPDPYSLSLPFSEMVASPGAIDWVSLNPRKAHTVHYLDSDCSKGYRLTDGVTKQAEFDRYVMGGNVPVDVESVYPSM